MDEYMRTTNYGDVEYIHAPISIDYSIKVKPQVEDLH